MDKEDFLEENITSWLHSSLQDRDWKKQNKRSKNFKTKESRKNLLKLKQTLT